MSAKKPKKRATPALDAALLTISKLHQLASRQGWSPRLLRTRLREARHVCKPVWRRALKKVFGVGVKELPDLRQLTFGGGL